METCGIIAEYNPFHHGHVHQIRQVRRRLGANTGIVVAMSGDFVQRGGPAIADKWRRAAWAVENGADLAVELPVSFATASAERFASGGVYLLNALGIVRHLAFGAETEELAPLAAIAAVLAEESDTYKRALADGLSRGSGFAAARQAAVGALLGEPAAAPLAASNAILAVSYLVAVTRQRAALKPLLIPRRGPGEHAGHSDGHLASASLIRAVLLDAFRRGAPAEALTLAPLLPPSVLGDLFRAGFAGALGSFDRLFPFALARLLTESADELKRIPSLQPDLAERLVRQAADRTDPADADAFVRQAATRAYPASRVRRALTDLYLGPDVVAPEAAWPAVCHVLAFSKRGRHLLKLMKTHARLPVVTRSSDVFELTGEARRELTGIQRAADLYALLRAEPTRADFDQSVTIV